MDYGDNWYSNFFRTKEEAEIEAAKRNIERPLNF